MTGVFPGEKAGGSRVSISLGRLRARGHDQGLEEALGSLPPPTPQPEAVVQCQGCRTGGGKRYWSLGSRKGLSQSDSGRQIETLGSERRKTGKKSEIERYSKLFLSRSDSRRAWGLADRGRRGIGKESHRSEVLASHTWCFSLLSYI